jgi:parallel beta-helix repeat protein
MGRAMVERGNRVFVIVLMVLSSVIFTLPLLAPGSEGLTYESDPIVVEGDGGFSAAGFTGSGTAGDPYVLKDVNLNASLELNGIRVSNTTAHFRLVGITVHDSYSPDRDPLNISASGSGILLINVTNAVIEDYLGDFNVRGVTVVSSSNIIINDSRFNNNLEAGVHLVGCLDGSVKVTNNTFTTGSGDDAVLIERCLSVQVTGNDISGGINGIVVRAGGSGLGDHDLTENTLTGQAQNGISIGGSSMTSGDRVLYNTVRGAGSSGVLVSFGTSETISGNDISGCSQGIEVDWTDNEVSDNVLSNNTRGVLIGKDADRNLISGNWIMDGAFGILINPSQGNDVLDNVIRRMTTSDSAVGIYLGIGEVTDTLVEGNEITDCNVGIRAATVSGQEIIGLSLVDNNISGSLREGAYLLYTADSEFINNSFLSGGGNGVYLGTGCHDLLLQDNEASDNDGAGLYLRGADDILITGNLMVSNLLEGVYLEAGSGNVIHGNALLFNKDSGRQYSPLRSQAYCGEAGNNWSLGAGNLWTDWLSPDVNDDGIVDLPYNISGGYQDQFPLTSISGLVMPEDITPPEVVANAPQGRDAEQGGAISVTFSEDMNASSVIVQVNGVQANGTWDDRTYVLDMGLEFESDYQVVVIGEDLSGNALEQFGWAFRTEDRDAQITGRVIDENAQPMSDVLLRVGEQEARSNVDGRFSLLLSPGIHMINISADGYLDQQYMVTVEEGGDADLGNITLERAPADGGAPMDLVLYAGLILTGVLLAAAALLLWRKRK